MGTSAGNYGRSMYKDPKWKTAISKGLTRPRIKVTKICPNPKCDNSFEVERLLNKDSTQRISKKERKFCSRKCANSKVFTLKQNKSKGRKGAANKLWKSNKRVNCRGCGKEISKKNKTGLCQQCLLKHGREQANQRRVYRNACQFDFHLADYPNEFDFDLIKKHGWYKALNHGNNLGGVSRDHIISIDYGYKNNIDPELMKHPANCQLLIHNDNISKNLKCELTLEELQQKIEKWNKDLNGKYSRVC